MTTATPNPRPEFVTTHWSVVLTVGGADSTAARAALESLCRNYWYPLYAFARRQTRHPEDAQDMTQEFFLRLLEKDYLKSADREKGRFRTFLLVAMKRFMANEWDRARAQKRGGGQTPLSFDTSAGESLYAAEPAMSAEPEKTYDRRWALTLLNRTMTRLRQEFAAANKAAEFEQLKDVLTAERGAIPYAEIASSLGISEGAARVAVHRLRQRFRELFREEIAHTVSTAEEIDDEVRYLVSVMAE